MAPVGNQNAVGNSGGKAMNNRKLAAEVRELALTRIKALLELPRVDMQGHDAELYDQILVKLAGSVMPRITEVTGEDGGAISVDMPAQAEINSALLAFLTHGTKPATNSGKDTKPESGVTAPPVPVHDQG